MGGCQNYGPFVGPYHNTAPNIYGAQKGDHNFDNHPYGFKYTKNTYQWALKSANLTYVELLGSLGFLLKSVRVVGLVE